MSVSLWQSAAAPAPASALARYSKKPRAPQSKPTSQFLCLSFPIDDIVHNKVLVAAAVSVAVGQLSKPFTSAVFHGRDSPDFKAVIRAGGFPSSHTSTTVAAATTLALERGLSDSIVGMAIVYAALVMYDAQGVRREVGKHSKFLNQLPAKKHPNLSVLLNGADVSLDSQPGRGTFSFILRSNDLPISSEETASLTLQLTKVVSTPAEEQRVATYSSSPIVQHAVEEGTEQVASRSPFPLKEAIGHSEVEVLAGALLGFMVGFAISTRL